jgi:hypothetical protein
MRFMILGVGLWGFSMRRVAGAELDGLDKRRAAPTVCGLSSARKDRRGDPQSSHGRCVLRHSGVYRLVLRLS